VRLVLCQVYPEHLSIYADRGNVLVIRRRCEWRGIEVEERPLRLGEELAADEVDLFLVGGGQDRDQALVAADLVRHRGELEAAVASGAVVLGVCGGYQLLGHSYVGHHGDRLEGVGLLDVETVAGDGRMIGNIVCTSDLAGEPRRIVGFENHAGRTLLGPAARPLARVETGHGNDGHSGFEGAHQGGVVGTYVHGPLLPKNPWLADWLIARALRRRCAEVVLEPLDDALEHEAARIAAARA
jgi:CobQ-like glutamine amidotransferase family enzyme